MPVMGEDPLSAKSIFLYLFGMWGKTGINCFVMITGYFMCKSQITLRKFLKLLLEIEFYNVVIYLIFLLSGYEPFGPKLCLQAFVPFLRLGRNNFPNCYLVFFLVIPYLNVLVQHIDRKQHFRLIALCLTTFTLLASCPGFAFGINYVFWFSILYLVSSYIRLYGLLPRVSHVMWGWLTLGSVTLSMLSVASLVILLAYLGKEIGPYRLVSDSNAIFAFLTAFCSFMFFKDMKLKQSKWINTVAATTFGVLLLHNTNAIMNRWLWEKITDNIGVYHTGNVYLHAILCTFSVFAVCSLIDYIRIHTLERWLFRWIDRKLPSLPSWIPQ